VIRMAKIVLPKGFFNACYECKYANFNDKDERGRIRCPIFGNYVDIEEKKGCFHFKIYTDECNEESKTKIENNSADNED